MKEITTEKRYLLSDMEQTCGEISVEYSLLEGTVEKRPSYTVVIRADGDEAVLFDITSEKERATEIFEILCRGLVTPTTAYDIIEELLS